MVLLVLASLWFAFRRATEILLGAALSAAERLVPAGGHGPGRLVLEPAQPDGLPADAGHGRGLHHLHAVRPAPARRGPRVVRRSIGRALLFCGGTAMAGFGSLAWSSNPGMASLGKVCAVGIGANMLISVFLLPAWWVKALSPKPTAPNPKPNGTVSAPPPPARITGAGAERRIASRTTARSFFVLPRRFWRPACSFVAGCAGGFCQSPLRGGGGGLCPGAAAAVEAGGSESLPVVAGDRLAAEKAARRLHHTSRRSSSTCGGSKAGCRSMNF